MTKVFLSALAIACLAATASAEEGGTLVLEAGGESYQFELWAAQSDWSGSESYGSVNIYARPANEEAEAKFSLLTLGFELVNGTAGNPEAGLKRVVESGTERLFAGDEEEEGGLAVNVESASVDGDELAVSGDFSIRMGTSDNFGRDIDLTAPLEASGSFDVVLGPVQ